MRATLEIVITHWREPWAVCEKMFQMLDVQRGMTRAECRVTVVQDGESPGIDYAQLMRRYPFVTRVIRIPHGGVSAARNAGIDAADAEWILFADCDDMLYSCDSLRTILDALQTVRNTDIVWGRTMTENRGADGKWFTSPQGWNLIFIHGKCWRLDWLRERGLRFDERIAYSEDSLFCALAATETAPARVREIPETVWMWCLRGSSCTSSPELAARNRAHLTTHRIIRPQLLEARGKDADAACAALRGIYDSYYELTGGTLPAAEREETEGRIARELILPWEEKTGAVSAGDRRKIMGISREDAARKGLFETETELFGEWVRRLKETYGRDCNDHT